MTSLGDKIRMLRKNLGLTLEQLAEKTDSSKGYIWELENRDTKSPSADKLQKIAEALSTTAEFLLDEKQTDPEDMATKQAVFFRKLEQLNPDDRDRVMQIIETFHEKK
jgi:transcriptional regulator with XRE-family HTH domain